MPQKKPRSGHLILVMRCGSATWYRDLGPETRCGTFDEKVALATDTITNDHFARIANSFDLLQEQIGDDGVQSYAPLASWAVNTVQLRVVGMRMDETVETPT